jgi:hypothetical protein
VIIGKPNSFRELEQLGILSESATVMRSTLIRLTFQVPRSMSLM